MSRVILSLCSTQINCQLHPIDLININVLFWAGCILTFWEAHFLGYLPTSWEPNFHLNQKVTLGCCKWCSFILKEHLNKPIKSEVMQQNKWNCHVASKPWAFSAFPLSSLRIIYLEVLFKFIFRGTSFQRQKSTLSCHSINNVI